MTYLTKMLAAVSTTGLNPLDDRYFNTAWPSIPTAAGVAVGPETALKLSAVYACDRLLSETVASLPAVVFQSMPDGSRQQATNHPLYDVLTRQPNARQTAFEFFDFMTHCAIMRGNGYARIKAGPRGFADQLIPLHPDRVTPERLDDDTLRYKVRRPDGTSETLNDTDVFHLKGMSADGIVGTSVINYAKESFGLGLGAEQSGARLFGNNSEPGGVLKTEKKLSDEASKRLKSEWEAMHSGPNAHRVAVLEEGLSWQAVAVSHKDAQFLETREFQAEDACRWFRVPPHMVGLTSKATSWGSGIEQMSLGFVIYTLMPWLVRWQQAISRDLILAPQMYFVEFLIEALLRGDLKSRYDAYAIARNWGWMSANDVLKKEHENPIAGGDLYLQPNTSVPAGTPPPAPAAPAPSVPAKGTSGAHYRELVTEAAARVVRKEMAALGKAAKRAGPDGDAWAQAVQDFYEDHAALVAQTLHMSADMAAEYVAAQVAELLAGGPAAMADWDSRAVARLAALVPEAA